MYRPISNEAIRNQRTINQVARILVSRFPTKATDQANYGLIFDALEELNGTDVFSDTEVIATIESIRDSLDTSPQFVNDLKAVRAQRWDVEWNNATVALLIRIAGEELGDISEAGMLFAIAQNESSFPRSAAARQQADEKAQAQRDAKEAVDLRETLLASHAKQQKNFVHQEYVWKEVRKKEIARVNALDLQQLRDEVSRRSLGTRLAGMDKETRRETVRALAKAAEPAPNVYDSYPKLPRTFYPRGSLTPVPMDAAFLKQVAANDREWFSLLRRKYGPQIAERMLEKD